MLTTEKYLQSYGVRPSVQRTAVMNYLRTHFTHPTAEEIYRALSPSMPTLSKTTVYNTLKLLVERGAVHSLDIDPRNERFDADISLHAHFMCSCCGTISDMRLGEEILAGLAPAEGAEIRCVQLLCRGVCAACRESEKRNKTI